MFCAIKYQCNSGVLLIKKKVIYRVSHRFENNCSGLLYRAKLISTQMNTFSHHWEDNTEKLNITVVSTKLRLSLNSS